MAKDKNNATKPLEKRGGYAAGSKLISELKPPPPGPAPGSKKPPASDDKT